MKVLLIGLGQIGLGLIVPVFQKAGYELVGTDANVERLNQLRNGYVLKTPGANFELNVDVRTMDEVDGQFDLVITSVGRQHLDKVADWLELKNISAPVLLAENLPDPVNLFKNQIPIIVDRICPRVEMRDGVLTAIAEDYFKIVILDGALTRPLGKVKGVELENNEKDLEVKRKQKMFMVNTAHLIAALYGQKKGLMFVEEAVAEPEISSIIEATLSEIGQWLGFDAKETAVRTQGILKRLASPLKDPLSRILNLDKKLSSLRYVEVPLKGIRSSGKKVPVLEGVYKVLTA
ncbi:MAG: hypothetical protein Q8P07_05305 [bacterium]|nr:hypothetical protein [bacterium]